MNREEHCPPGLLLQMIESNTAAVTEEFPAGYFVMEPEYVIFRNNIVTAI
jgi:hypothetical protein